MGRLHAMKLKYQKVGISYIYIESLCTVQKQIIAGSTFFNLEHLIFDPMDVVALCREGCITALG